MPDYFVPVDTSGGSAFFNRLSVSGLIYRYALKYSDDNREKLASLQTAAEFKDFLTQESIMKKLISFASENGLTASRHDLESSGEVIEIQLKAYIARNFLDNDGFYPIWEGLDTTLREAIEYLDTL